jgi:hypothetical protein
MYKPNGEEPMTKQEEARRKAALTERTRKAVKPEGLRSAFYAALYGNAHAAEDNISLTQAQ